MNTKRVNLLINLPTYICGNECVENFALRLTKLLKQYQKYYKYKQFINDRFKNTL